MAALILFARHDVNSQQKQEEKMYLLQGFKTITFNIVAISATWLATEHGIDLPEEHQTAISVTIISVINIVLRLITKTSIGKKDKKWITNTTYHILLEKDWPAEQLVD